MENGNEVLRAIRERRSIRKFLPEHLKQRDLEAILEAGKWAASAKGLQSALMVVVDNPGDVETLRKANAAIWGRPDIDPFYAAPDIVVVLADGDTPNWLQDGSLVMGNLMLAAYAVGAGSCWIRTCRKTNDSAFHLDSALLWALQATEREDYLFASP
ncbi:MAG: nitroreductase family protein [Oscillospiraceae bacterium]|nr:nitroreductase family protein [Oscillospiraceae bacterium]